MPVSQMEGYFKNPYFKRTYALSVGFKMKPLPKRLHPINLLLRGLDPPAPLMLATLPFPLIMFSAGSYDIHARHSKMACD